jgi:hypothetical protein
MEALTGLLLLLFALLLPLLPGISQRVARWRRELAVQAAQQRAHSPQRERTSFRPLPVPPALPPRYRSLEELAPRPASREEFSLERLPERPMSLETITPEGTREGELVMVAPPAAQHGLLRGPGEVRRGILLAALLGTPRGLER